MADSSAVDASATEAQISAEETTEAGTVEAEETNEDSTPAVTADGAAPTQAAEEPAADLPSLEDLDAVAAEVQRVETALPLLDKKNSPMCAACQSAFADATTVERLDLLQCDHGVAGAA